MVKKNKENKKAENPLQTFNDLEEARFKDSGEEAIKAPRKAKNKTFPWRKIGGIVALFLLVLASILLLKDRLGGGFHQEFWPPSKGSNDEFSAFMNYEGPVLPLMIGSENQDLDIHAHRKLVYDFYPVNNTNPNVQTVFLKDQYLIKTSGQENKIKVLYPFVSSVDDMYYAYPRIEQDGRVLEAKLYYGNYMGDFVSTKDEMDPSETLNLRDAASWEEYKKILDEKSYLKASYSSPPDIRDLPVTVYSFSKSYSKESAEGEAPTLVAGIKINRNKSTVLSLGFDGFAKLDDSGEEFYQYSIPKENEASFTEDKHYLMIVGEDSASIKVETQSIGGWDGYQKKSSKLRNNLKNAGADLERKEMSLDDALDLMLPILFDRYKENQIARERDLSYWKLNHHGLSPYSLSYDDFKALYTKELFATGALSKKPMMRYEDGNLDSMDVTNTKRIIFAEVEMELEKNKTIDLTISSYKKGSYDFYGPRYKEKIYGYDILTGLDSSIALDKYEVEMIDYGKVAPVKQNFAFDLDKDLRKVTLSKDIPHYFMEVTEKK